MKTNLTFSNLLVKSFSLLLAFIFTFSLFLKPVKTDARHSKEFKIFEGSYQLLGNQNAFIKISAYVDQLTLKESWSNNEISFKQKSELSFVSNDHPDFTLDFARDQNGTITQVVAFKKDVWIKMKPQAATVKLSPAEIKKLTNAYQTIFTAFVEAINSNSDEKIQSFLKTHMDESVLKTLTSENLIMRAKEMYQNTGGIERVTQSPIDVTTGTATFKDKKQGNLFQMNFSVNSAGKIINFGMKE
ncbi:hypothetical protein [Adhaeribacter radiodurans]|uniref:DUF3887 domain-containing protein n=1 Tax=Adhaeribacter radiodurans TaxID=2745197 RepID=A0A7L7L400_9BACT|nr:hypothetical protein [Adhaeribacter radiodurans]QMU27526.1 hypothetical protein HUW48_05500 [Adhaeribacter radiodurans]